MHAMACHGGGRRVGELLQEGSDPFGTLACDQLVGVLEADERDRGLAMLADPLRLNAESLLQRNESLEVRPGPVGFAPVGRARHRVRIPPQQVTALHRRTDESVGDLLGHGRADTNFAGFGTGLARKGRRHVGTGQQELAVHALRQKHREGAAMQPDGDAEPHRPAVSLVDRPGDEGPHAMRGPAGPHGVPVTGEEHEQRVASELDHVPALFETDADHGVEARVQEVGEFLGAATTH